MRKIFVACLLCFASLTTQAQTTAQVTLTVDISNVSSIVIGATFQNPTLVYATQADFTNGVTLNQPDAMQVFSNRPYSVTVVAATDLNGPGSNVIAVNNVKVTPTTATTVPGLALSTVAIPTGTPLPIMASTAGTLGQTASLAYTTVGSPATNFLKPPGLYTTTLTYTITNP